MPDVTLPAVGLPPTYVRLLDDIRRRLRPVCTELPTSEFDALTTRIAEAEMRHRGHEMFIASASANPAND
jgi:hypothetical protein